MEMGMDMGMRIVGELKSTPYERQIRIDHT